MLGLVTESNRASIDILKYDSDLGSKLLQDSSLTESANRLHTYVGNGESHLRVDGQPDS